MKPAFFPILCLTLCLIPLAGQGQEKEEETNPWKPARPAFQDAVRRAKIQAQRVISQENGGTLTVDVIAPPAIQVEAIAVIPPVIVPVSAAKLGARRLAVPNDLRLFSPTVIVYPETGISRISWFSIKGFKEYSALVRLDLSSIMACGDLQEGRRRYLLIPCVRMAGTGFTAKEKSPKLTAFQQDTDIILTQGDPADAEAMEPLTLLLHKYDTEGGLIASTAAAMKADQEARVAWEQAHPEKPENVVIKMWPVQSTEYPAVKTAGQ